MATNGGASAPSHARSLSAPAAASRPLRRRTYTTNQFNYVWRPSHQRSTGEARRLCRPSSPNRHNNPQPLGMTYQAAYNREGQVFGSWNPSMNLVLKGLPTKIYHSVDTNFTCGQKNDEVTKDLRYGPLADVELPPKFQSVTSTSFQAPQAARGCVDRGVPVSRYGSHTERTCAANGIVPSTLCTWQTDRRKKPCNRSISLHKSF